MSPCIIKYILQDVSGVKARRYASQISRCWSTFFWVVKRSWYGSRRMNVRELVFAVRTTSPKEMRERHVPVSSCHKSLNGVGERSAPPKQITLLPMLAIACPPRAAGADTPRSSCKLSSVNKVLRGMLLQTVRSVCANLRQIPCPHRSPNVLSTCVRMVPSWVCRVSYAKPAQIGCS